MKIPGGKTSTGIAEAGGEIISGLGSVFEKSVKQTKDSVANELSETLRGVKKQIIGLEKELREGDETLLETKQEDKLEKRPISVEHQAYVREILNTSSREENEERQQISVQIEEIRAEIVKLKETSSEMELVFDETTSQDIPEKPGKYHLAFYEWVLLSIKTTRKKMEEVNILGRIFQSRKREKQYLGMAKKYGTSFTLNHERAIVRQTG